MIYSKYALNYKTMKLGAWVDTLEEVEAKMRARPDMQPDFIEKEHKAFLDSLEEK
jgi:hypothetical protein